MNTRVLMLVLGLAVPLSASAIVLGGSNLGFDGYPSMNCTKPQKPYKPYSFSDQSEIDSYNNQVDEYNADMSNYVECVRKYIDNANNDIGRIKEKIQEAVNDTQS